MNLALRNTLLLALSAGALAAASSQRSGGELRFCIKQDLKTFDPFLVYDDSSETVRYLTGAPLLRLNRKTQQAVAEVAQFWKLGDGGRSIRFELRPGVKFSDGSALTATHVIESLKTFFDPKTQAPDADSFGVDLAKVQIKQTSPASVTVTFPKPIAGLERLFDTIPIASSASHTKGVKPESVPATGPFRVAEYRAGSYLLLTRNPYYWKTDAAGTHLPYLDAVRLYIQPNAALQLLRFQHGETDLIASVDPESYPAVAARPGVQAFDLGPSLDTEQMWFNEAPNAPLPDYKKRWFASSGFRAAVSRAIDRADLARVGYFARATPSNGPVSPANEHWVNQKLPAPVFDRKEALRLLAKEGFRKTGDSLVDRDGHPVEFSLITNAGNKVRERLASLVQSDLAQIGIRLNMVAFDFPALLQRITRTANYEACLLGLVNSDLDPNGQMNVWLSSGTNHAWNPGQTIPATAWEKEIDVLMTAQATELSDAKRKNAFDRVQAISGEQNPALYLITKHALSAFGPAVANPSPAVLFPQAFWNADGLYLKDGSPSKLRQVAQSR